MKKIILRIDGMSCSACQNRVEKYLNKQDGVKATVNLVMAQALIFYDEDKVSLSDLDRFVEEAGYKSLGEYCESADKRQDYSKYYFIGLGLLIIALMIISMLHIIKNPVIYGISLLILTIPFIIYGFDIIRSGVLKFIHKSPNMDTLVTIGVFASFIYSSINLILVIFGNYIMIKYLYFESSAMIIYFIKLGRFIDKRSKEKTKDAIRELVQITPQSALLKTSDGEKEVTIDEVNVGDVLICKAGMKIAVDGVIISGDAYLDEAFITGESVPFKKKKNDKVVAGSMNLDGVIEYKAVKIGPDSTISEIVKLVIEAVNTKAPISRIADIVAGFFVPSIIIIAILTFVISLLLGHEFNDSIISFVSVLVVACPCALGLATPLAIVVSEGMSARNGILIKSSEVLENAHKVDTIVFDKTGTLTYGNLRISTIYNYSEYTDKDLLRIVAGLEKGSTHPIASAFSEYYDKKIMVDNFKNINGIGISGVIDNKKYYLGNDKLFKKLNIDNNYSNDYKILINKGNSIIYVIEDKKIIALIGVRDIVRENVKDVILELKKIHKDIIIITGDNEKTASIIAKKLGIDNVIANVMPKDKENILKKLMRSGHRVMMVGDGINDAPALAVADIGVSINGGTDIAGDSSDVILMQDDLSKIISLLNISSRTVKIIKENLFWAFIYNILMIPLATNLFGIGISPMIASISMTLSSLCVVFNSLRLKKY